MRTSDGKQVHKSTSRGRKGRRKEEIERKRWPNKKKKQKKKQKKDGEM
jgi:hypothetical protein